MSSMEEIQVLNREARRRGISYGKLVAALSEGEKQQILKEAERAGRKKKRAGGR